MLPRQKYGLLMLLGSLASFILAATILYSYVGWDGPITLGSIFACSVIIKMAIDGY